MQVSLNITFKPGVSLVDAGAAIYTIATEASFQLTRQKCFAVDDDIPLVVNSPYVEEASLNRTE